MRRGKTAGKTYAGKPRNLKHRRGESSPQAKTNEETVRAIRIEYSLGKTSQMALARKYGLTYNIVNDIVNNRSWRHVKI